MPVALRNVEINSLPLDTGMITFNQPYYLHALWIMPAVIAFLIFLRSYRRIGTDNMQIVGRMIMGYSPYIMYIKYSLFTTAFVLLVLALARPKVIRFVERPPAPVQTAVVFALDVSKSMLVTDIAPDRLTIAKKNISAVLSGLHGEQAGVVLFAGNANTYIPLTTDYKMLNNAISFASNNSVDKQGTSLSKALKTSAVMLLQKNIRVRYICLLSDGENLDSSFSAAADSARKAGIQLFALGVGTQHGEHILQRLDDGTESVKKDKSGKPVISRLHRENLVRIAGNNHYQALTNPAENAAAFLKSLHQTQGSTKQRTALEEEYFQLFLGLALLLVVVEALIPQSVNKT